MGDSLNRDFTRQEIRKAAFKFQDHKASGLDGLPCEFLKYGGPILHASLTSLANRVLHEQYPAEWAQTALSPIVKPKGDPYLFDNHRGIAVGDAVPKLISILFHNRLSSLAEIHGWRARGQAGFRPRRGTMDNVFNLHAMIEKAKFDKQSLYVAFIDFRKAYDLVDREVLWKCLSCLGVHGDMLRSIKEMYKDVRMKVRL